MANPIKKPCYIAGTPRSSGDVQTGEVNTTRGGGRTFTRMSGIIGGDVQITSGGGRLNSVTVLNNLVSGQSVIFYDGAAATSGGPFATSGHKVLAVIPTVWHPSASGNLCPNAVPGTTFFPETPFQSGLNAAVVSSGSCGWSVAYTPESNVLGEPGGSIVG